MRAMRIGFERRLIAAVGLCVVLVGTGGVFAEDIQTWPFDLETWGEDVYWTSPTAVDNTAPTYHLSHEITEVWVTVEFMGFPIDVDVTGEVDPNMLSGASTDPGPPPMTVYEDTVVYPDPNDPGLSAYVVIALNAEGYGTASVTEVYLGEIEVEIPPFGMVTVPVQRIQVIGTLTAHALDYAIGDMNCDGVVDFGDINAFVLALTDPDGYAAAYPHCNLLMGDCDGNGELDFGDINAFVALLSGGG